VFYLYSEDQSDMRRQRGLTQQIIGAFSAVIIIVRPGLCGLHYLTEYH